jgi:hypothetical protein
VTVRFATLMPDTSENCDRWNEPAYGQHFGRPALSQWLPRPQRRTVGLKCFSSALEVLAKEVVNNLENIFDPEWRTTMVRPIQFIHHHGFVVLL